MASRYRIGYYYERKVKILLEKNGWDVWRSPASHSPVDIIAIRPEENTIKVKFIQIKRTSRDFEDIEKAYKYEIEKMLDLAKRYQNFQNVDIELWVFKKDNKNPQIINIKNFI